MVEKYDTVEWRGRDVAYRVFDSNNVQVIGFCENGGYSPVEQKLEKKCRAHLRGVDLGQKVEPRANIYFSHDPYGIRINDSEIPQKLQKVAARRLKDPERDWKRLQRFEECAKDC